VLKKIYEADGISDAVEFKLSPGVRGPEHTHKPGYSCVDEDNCDNEEYFLCGQSLGGGVEWLACLDASEATPAKKAQSCAAPNKLDFTKISSCFSGTQGKSLLKAASLHFDGKFPKPVGVPTIEIDGVALGNDRTYATIIKDLCAKGIKAGACSKTIVV